VPEAYSLRNATNVGDFGESRSGRLLQAIRRFMDMSENLMRPRRRNEEVLALAYHDPTMLGGADQYENLRQYALNLPYRYNRWLISMATSKKFVLKVGRDAGPGQRPGGPSDADTGMWVGIALGKVAHIAGFKKEMSDLIGEMVPRGVSVMSIGYHEDTITVEEAQEAGKDAQSILPDIAQGDLEAHPGQAHAEISEGLGAMADNEFVQAKLRRQGIDALLTRKQAHDDAALEDELDETPIASSRVMRHRVWMRKLRVGEDVGWNPAVYDTCDTDYWWVRKIKTMAEVKASDAFSDEFKAAVEGNAARNASNVVKGGKTVATESMGSDARQAQTEEALTDDEMFVEYFEVWFRRPKMKSGGIRRIVCGEWPDHFCEADDQNPHVDDKGFSLIPNFYPFWDFAPIKSSLPVPEATLAIPPMAVGMTQFERITEYNRLRGASALRHSIRNYQFHPALQEDERTKEAFENGEDGYGFFAPQSLVDSNGKMNPAVIMLQFTGNTQEIDRQAAREVGDFLNVVGMPPAIYQGMGTADTLGQDQVGVAAGEAETATVVDYLEDRMADVMAGIRGLVRGNYDDEDFIPMLGANGAKILKAWQVGTEDIGDEIELTFGRRAIAQATVEKKQLMEAITLEQQDIDPSTGLSKWDSTALFEELHRRLEVGPPKVNETLLAQLQQKALAYDQLVEAIQEAEEQKGKPGSNGRPSPSSGGGPRPAEGDGPSPQNIDAGAKRGTALAGAPGPQ
jgi:hypothetical protein